MLLCQVLWQAFRGHAQFWRRGSKMTSGKFLSLLKLQKEKLDGWTFTKLALLYYALSSGSIRQARVHTLMNSKVSTMLRRVVAAPNAEASERPTLRQEAQQHANATKDLCNSGLELGITMFSDPDNKIRYLFCFIGLRLGYYHIPIHEHIARFRYFSRNLARLEAFAWVGPYHSLPGNQLGIHIYITAGSALCIHVASQLWNGIRRKFVDFNLLSICYCLHLPNFN